MVSATRKRWCNYRNKFYHWREGQRIVWQVHRSIFQIGDKIKKGQLCAGCLHYCGNETEVTLCTSLVFFLTLLVQYLFMWHSQHVGFYLKQHFKYYFLCVLKIGWMLILLQISLFLLCIRPNVLFEVYACEPFMWVVVFISLNQLWHYNWYCCGLAIQILNAFW